MKDFKELSDANGNLRFLNGQSVRLSCPGSRFAAIHGGITDITVQCDQNENFIYNSINYNFYSFGCMDVSFRPLKEQNFPILLFIIHFSIFYLNQNPNSRVMQAQSPYNLLSVAFDIGTGLTLPTMNILFDNAVLVTHFVKHTVKKFAVGRQTGVPRWAFHDSHFRK